MSLEVKYQINHIESPFWVFAIHDGHEIDAILKPYINLPELDLLREEDPFTAQIASIPVHQFFVSTSRFQLDLNRCLEDAVYLKPEQAWGLHVYADTLPEGYLEKLYEQHRFLYSIIERNIEETIEKHGFFIILDIHSYNAKRNSPSQNINVLENPQINLGTYYNKSKWTPVIKEYASILKEKSIDNQSLDVRENVKFKGGNLAQHIIRKYGELGCVISIEFRKDFMDEWTGIPDLDKIEEYKNLLATSTESLFNSIQKCHLINY